MSYWFGNIDRGTASWTSNFPSFDHHVHDDPSNDDDLSSMENPYPEGTAGHVGWDMYNAIITDDGTITEEEWDDMTLKQKLTWIRNTILDVPSLIADFTTLFGKIEDYIDDIPDMLNAFKEGAVAFVSDPISYIKSNILTTDVKNYVDKFIIKYLCSLKNWLGGG